MPQNYGLVRWGGSPSHKISDAAKAALEQYKRWYPECRISSPMEPEPITETLNVSVSACAAGRSRRG